MHTLPKPIRIFNQKSLIPAFFMTYPALLLITAFVDGNCYLRILKKVIKGEDPAEYEAFHDKFLAELYPVGMVETMLAERFVSLAWRLRRAERMQNQVIEDMIERKVTNRSARHHQENYYYNQGIRPGDPRFDLDHLPLGRIATSDWSNCRVLDRMMLYERRIENSMTKMMKELKRHEIMRRIEHEDAGEQQYLHAQSIPRRGTGFQPVENMAKMAMPLDKASPSVRDEADTRRPAEEKVDLKKQTVRQGKLVQFSRFESCPAKVGRPAGM